jgi:predicted kinase
MGMVYVMRGIPGTGKTTYVNKFTKEHPELRVSVCSADHYHMRDGEYKFDPKNLAAAHQECLKLFINCMSWKNADVVFVDNTNITVTEIAPYVAVAQALGWRAEVITLLADPWACAKRNVHGVPEDKVWKMLNLMDGEEKRFPPFWTHHTHLGG